MKIGQKVRVKERRASIVYLLADPRHVYVIGAITTVENAQGITKTYSLEPTESGTGIGGDGWRDQDLIPHLEVQS